MTTFGIVIAHYGDVRTEESTVIALVADAAIEATFCFTNSQTGANLEIDFSEGLKTFLTQQAGLDNSGRESEVVAV
jgi:hypothetical protein